MTTQTLHVRGRDGYRYVLRSVRKVTRQALAEEFWGTPVEAIMQDQLCSFHPSGAPVVARLLEAVDVLHPEPQLMVIPDDPRLGEFREEFAGMLVLFEERPDDLPDGEAGFGGSTRIVQTDDLFDELEDHASDRVDAEELLRSRLVDLLVGDRDRSINNYLWARYDAPGGGHDWRPIPRDRDQAFVRFDGAVKAVGRLYEPRLVSFDEDYSSITGLSRNAWDIDRTLLVSLEREAWDSVVAEVEHRLTDAVIEEAVDRMPKAHRERVGAELAAALRHRRDQLPQAAEGLYEIVFREADVRASDQDEIATFTPAGEGGVRLTLRPEDSRGDAPPSYSRTFSPTETEEIRLYLHGGDDLARLEAVDSPIRIRIVGGGGADEIDSEAVGGEVWFYDDGDGSEVRGQGVRWIRRDVPRRYAWWTEGEGDVDFGSRTWPELRIGYDPDRGLIAGAGFKRERYDFLETPYGSRLHLSGGWAFGRSQPTVEARHIRNGAPGGVTLDLAARYSGFEIVRFYGFGNASEAPEPPEYYEVHQKQLAMTALGRLGDEAGPTLSLGPVYRRTASDTTNPTTLVTQLRVYGTGTFQQAGLQASFELDRRDPVGAPSGGYRLALGGSVYPRMLDVEDTFGEIHWEAATFLSPGRGNPTLALRVGGKHLWGTFPYSDAAFVGGSDNVRGLREQRFAGASSVFGSLEVRVFLTRVALLFPTDIGVFGLSDAGRIFMEGHVSGDWHHSVGGGIWIAPVSRAATVQLSLAQSEGRRAFYVGTGFPF
jgi:hypothetical protein